MRARLAPAESPLTTWGTSSTRPPRLLATQSPTAVASSTAAGNGCLWRAAVVHREHGPTRSVDRAAAVRVVGLEVAVDEAAAVEVEQQTTWRRRRVEPAGHPGSVDVADLGDALARLDRGPGCRLRAGVRNLGPVLVGHHAPQRVRLGPCRESPRPWVGSSSPWSSSTRCSPASRPGCTAPTAAAGSLATGPRRADRGRLVDLRLPQGAARRARRAAGGEGAGLRPRRGRARRPRGTPAGRSRSWRSRSSSTPSPSTPTSGWRPDGSGGPQTERQRRVTPDRAEQTLLHRRSAAGEGEIASARRGAHGSDRRWPQPPAGWSEPSQRSRQRQQRRARAPRRRPTGRAW